MRRPYLWLVPAALLLSGCGQEVVTRAAGSPTAAVAVQTRDVALEEWPALYEASGTVRARTTATLSSKVTGYVQQVSVQVGDRVHAGQLLLTLDARDLDVTVRRAEAARAEVEATIPELESSIAAARANLDLAQATFRRMQELAASKSISNQEFDEASARLKAAQASYDMAGARGVQLKSKMAQVEQEVKAAEILRDYAKVAAPFDGLVVGRSVEPGNLAAPGMPLLTLEREGQYRLEAAVEESRQGAVKVGQPVDAILQGIERKVSARVSEIVPAVDPASRTYIVKLDLPAMPQPRSGMFGRALFSAGAEKVAVVPAPALVERGQLKSVFVVENGAAHSRLVTTGRSLAGREEVLSGLSEGERVVCPVPPGMVDGMRVEVRQ